MRAYIKLIAMSRMNGKDKKKKSKDEALYGKVSAKGVSAIYSLNKLTGSPAYGITIVEES